MTKWREAVWSAVQRQAAIAPVVTRKNLIAHELAVICGQIGSMGATPQQTLTKTLNELRLDGVLLADSRGHYRVAAGIAAMPLPEAVLTETWKLQQVRTGQSGFRKALLEKWSRRCPLSGIADPPLLRASHIIPWNRCETDQERVDPDNGLLLSALWDAAFDNGLVSFDNEGRAIASRQLTHHSFKTLRGSSSATINNLSIGNRERLRWHRAAYGFS